MVTLDWRGPDHWHRRRRPCRLCRKPTNLRDTAGRPAHKVCVETAAVRLLKTGTKVRLDGNGSHFRYNGEKGPGEPGAGVEV